MEFDVATISCISIVAIFILAATYYEHRKKVVRIRSYDAISSTMLEISRSIPAWFLFWFLLSTLVGVVLPSLFAEDKGWLFGEPSGLLITLNYTFAVPMLICSYLNLLIKSDIFFSEKNLNELGIALKKDRTFKLFSNKIFLLSARIILFLSTLLVTKEAIDAILTTEEYIHSPWAKDANNLSIYGVFYYALRNIFAYLALGLMVLAFSIFFKFLSGIKIQDPTKLFDRYYKIKKPIQELSTSLSLCAFLSTLVAGLHGLSLFVEEKSYPDIANDILAASTWLYWGVATFLATFFLIFGVFWIHTQLKEGVHQIYDAMMENIEQLYKSHSESIDTFTAKIDSFVSVKEYIHSISVLPLSKGGVVMILISLIFQLTNFAIALLPNFNQ